MWVRDSLITRGRNKLVSHFLKSDCTHLFFIDADIENRKMRFLKRKNKAEVSTFEKINNMQSDYMKLKMTCDLIIYNNHKENFNKYFGIEIIKS